MPSGYTSRLCEGEQPFEEFVLQCARAFGACVMQRDAPIDELPTHNERDSYYTNALAAAKRTLSNMKKMSATRREAFAQSDTGRDLFKDIFGDHAAVLVTREGIDVEEYDHD